jgi:hypothetical protein
MTKEEQYNEAYLRRQAKKCGLVANKSRTDGKWTLTDHTNHPVTDKSLSTDQAIEFVRWWADGPSWVSACQINTPSVTS